MTATDPYIRALTGDAQQATVSLRRRYRAEPARVWDAITRPERIRRWFGTMVGPAPAAPGDEFHIDIGEGRVRRGVVDACDAPHALGYTWWSGDDDPGAVRIRLSAVGDGETELAITHDRLRPHWTVPYASGWESSLSALATVLGMPAERTGSTPRWELMRERPLELAFQIAAPRQRVWDAFTTEAGLSSWWWNHWSDVEVAADVRAGGGYRFAAPRHRISVAGEYLVVSALERLSFTWRWIDDDGISSDEAVDVVFGDDEDGTVITVRHTGPWADDEPVDAYREGWEFVLRALAATLESDD